MKNKQRKQPASKASLGLGRANRHKPSVHSGNKSASRDLLYYRASVASHPLLWVLLALFAFYFFPVGVGGLYRSGELVAGVFLFAVLPFALLYKPIKRGEITVNLENQEKRNKFFLPWAAIFAAAFAFYSYFNSTAHAELALAFFASMVFLHFANQLSKISWHAMGTTIISTILSHYYPAALVMFVTLVPFACFARLKLKAHTPFQLACGAIAGAAIALAALAIA